VSGAQRQLLGRNAAKNLNAGCNGIPVKTGFDRIAAMPSPSWVNHFDTL
jgi:hypothetical protein